MTDDKFFETKRDDAVRLKLKVIKVRITRLKRKKSAVSIRKMKRAYLYKKRRVLKAVWHVESMMGLDTQHGLNLEAEICAALSEAIAKEIDQETQNELHTRTAHRLD